MASRQREAGIASGIAMMVFISMFAGCSSSPVEPRSSANVRINYYVASQSHVTLKIVNSYNTTQAVLVDSVQSPGTYSISWSAASYPVGVYFYYLVVTPTSGGPPQEFVSRFVLGRQ